MQKIFRKVEKEGKEPETIRFYSCNVLCRSLGKQLYTVKQKGLKRIETQLDINKFMRRLFISDVISKNIIKKGKRNELRNRGKFVINLEQVTEQNLTSEDSDD